MNNVPEPLLDDNFVASVSPQYVEAYREGRIEELVYHEPYQFAFLNDLWAPEFYRRISPVNPSLTNSYASRTGYEIDIFYEPFYCEEFVRLVYGRPFRQFLGVLVGSEIATRPKDKYPQIRTILGGKGGMGIHDDHSAPYDGVAFFNFHDNWLPSHGGELVIWEKLDDQRYEKRFEFPPLGNSMSLMRLCPHSYHSVNNPKGNWHRTNVLVELNFAQDTTNHSNDETPGITKR